MEFESLIQQPESLRDGQWEKYFLDGIIPRAVAVESPEPSAGPDGWPYLRVRTNVDSAPAEPFARVVTWLAGRGIGLVVNAHKMMPDYVFTYGMIWNFVETGRFVLPREASPRGPVEFSGEQTLIGEPTPQFLPPYVRAILREFLAAQGFAVPRIAVATTADYKQTDLIFTTESLNDLPEGQHATMAEVLHWFLPQHYSVVFAAGAQLPRTFAL